MSHPVKRIYKVVPASSSYAKKKASVKSEDGEFIDWDSEEEKSNPDPLNENTPQFQAISKQISDSTAELKHLIQQQNIMIRHLKESMLEQNHVICSLIGEQKKLLQHMFQEDLTGEINALPESVPSAWKVYSGPNNAYVTFPIRTENRLFQMEAQLLDDIKEEYYKVQITNLLQKDLRKNLKNVITSDIVMEYNVSGTHGKKSFMSLKKTYNLLMEIIETLSPNQPFTADKQLRNAFAYMKHQHFKKASSQKKTFSSADDMIEEINWDDE